MRRTKPPLLRERIDEQGIEIEIKEGETSLSCNLVLQNFHEYNFFQNKENMNALIYLEIYMKNSRKFTRHKIATISDLRDDQPYTKNNIPLEDFSVAEDRSNIFYNLKITDPETSHLLGLVEQVRNPNYDDLIDIEYKKMNNIFTIKYSDTEEENSKLIINEKIKDHAYIIEKLKPLLAEIIFREILKTILIDANQDIDTEEDNPWIGLVMKYSKIKPDENMSEHIKNNLDEIVGNLSKDKKLVDLMLNNLSNSIDDETA